MKIDMFFVYPIMGIENKESSLFRIVDNDLKETLVIYLIKENNQYNVYMMNTMTGITNNIFKGQDLEEIDKFNHLFNKEKDNIIKVKDLYSIERYILKISND